MKKLRKNLKRKTDDRIMMMNMVVVVFYHSLSSFLFCEQFLFFYQLPLCD
jgi:hypothetical protein